MTLTSKQQKVFDFIESYIEENKQSPTYEEIRDFFGFRSLGSVVDYINYLKAAGYLRISSSNSARNLELIERSEPCELVPLLGKVAAGSPLDVSLNQSNGENISVPISMYRPDCYALEIDGDSMIEDGIFDGDIVLVKKVNTARNGQTVVALVEGGATIKRYYKKENKIELHPANVRLKPIIVSKGDFQIQGLLVGLIRQY